MFGLFTIRRRLLLGAGSMLLLGGLGLTVVHTPLVRRFVLVQAQIRLGNALGLVIEAKELDYNLFSARFELKDLSLRGPRASDLPAPLRAQRVVAMVPLWPLIRGSFDTARITVDGLSVQWITRRDGRSNWPRLPQPVSGGTSGPALLVTRGVFEVCDDRAGLLLHLPLSRLSGAWNAAAGNYAIAAEFSGGAVRWKDAQLPLDRLMLKSTLANGGLAIESFHLASGGSETQIRGTLSGTPSRIDATADLDLDLRALSPARGRLQAHVTAAGPTQAPQLKAALRSARVTAAGIAFGAPSAEVDLDTATGAICVRRLSASIFGGRLAAAGAVSGSSRLTASLTGFDARKAARALGGGDIPFGRSTANVSAAWPGLDWRHGSAHATVHSGSLSGDIVVTLGGESLTGAVRGKVENLAELAGIDGSATWSATLGGTIVHPTASGQLAANGLSSGAWTGGALDVQAEYAGKAIQVGHARLRWAGQQLELTGGIAGTSADAALHLAGTIEGNANLITQAAGPVSGTVRISGTIAQPVAETSLHAADLTFYGQRFARAALDARWQNNELTLERLAAEQDRGSDSPGRLEASASLDLATERYSARATGRDLQPTGLPVTGTFQFDAHGEGTLSSPAFSAQVDGSEVQAGGEAVGEFHASVNGADRRASLSLAAPDLNTKTTSTVFMEGAWPFDADVEARGLRRKTVSLSATASAAGTLLPLRLDRAAANVDNLRLDVRGHAIEADGPIELAYSGGRLRADRIALKSGASSLRLSGEMPWRDDGPPGSVAIEGTVDLAGIPHFLPPVAISELSGVATIHGTVSGSIRKWQPSGTVAIRDGRMQAGSIPFPLEVIEGGLQLENGVIRIDRLAAKAVNGTVAIAGSLPLHFLVPGIALPSSDPGQPARFTAVADKLQFSRGTGDQAMTANLSAKIEAEAPALSLAALRGTVEVTELQARTASGEWRQARPARIDVSGSVARLEQFEIGSGQGASLRATGTMGLTGDLPLDLRAEGTTGLGWLSLFAAPLEAGGTARLDLRVGGTVRNPTTTGSLELNQVSLSLPNPKLQAAGVRLRADLDGDHITVKELRGTLNGGGFTGGGDLKIGPEGLRDVNLFLNGKDTFVEYPFAVKSTSNLDVKLLSRQDRLVLTGNIDVQEGYYESAIDIFSSSGQGLEALNEVESGQPSRPVALDLKIVTRRPVEMDNNLGRLSATADLRLTGTVAKPGLVGTLDLEQEGKLYFGDRVYYVERGTVRFSDESKVEPELNIQAYTRTNDYTIRLGLTGKPSELTTTFTSDPPLSRDDVIAVLLTGKTVAENRGVDIRALEATSLATGAMNASLSSQAHRALGISRVSIQPGAIAAETNSGTRITVTQDFTNSLRLLYSMNLSDSNDQIWVGEYDLSRRFTTRMVKQSDNTYRGEFRHDVRFGSSSSTAASAAPAAARRKVSGVRFTGGAPFTADELEKVFKVKPGKTYKPMQVRKGSERLTRFFMKKGFLESRVRLDREDAGRDVGLTVRIEPGPAVDFAFHGASVSGKQRSRLRDAWHAGLSDQQRPQAATEALLGLMAQQGYLRAHAGVQVEAAGGRKSVRFEIQPGPRFRGVKLAVEGAGGQRVREIQSLLGDRQLKLALYRAPRRVSEALTAFYRQRGYLAAKVDPPRLHLDEARRTGRIVIAVVEGPTFRVGAIEFTGNQALIAAELRKGVPLEAGAVFEPARLDPTVAALRQKYGKLGYRDARIEYTVTRREDHASVDVHFAVTENRQTSVGAIAVEGNRHTSAGFVRSQLRIGEGQVANADLIRDSVKNLAQTGAFTSADIQVKPTVELRPGDKPVQVADLVVAVAEPKPFRLLYGGLYDSGNGPGFIADFQNHNSLGAGRILGVRLRKDSETDEARLYVTKPFWRMHRLSTTIAAYATRQTEYHQTTPTETLGVSIQQDLQLRSKWQLSYGYRYERQHGFVPDPAAPEIPVKVVSVAPISLTMSRDARDSFLDATRGSFISHAFEIAPHLLGSEYPYARYYIQYFKYFPLTRPHPVLYGVKPQRSRLVFATGSRLGLQKGFNPEGAVLTDRFYAGGGTTVRGFRQDELGPKLANGQPAGGNAVLVLNEELRYPLFWIFDAVTFVDVGNVFPRVSDFRFSDLRSAGGFGLRLRNPFVVLRFDYGFKFARRPGETLGAFFFSIGQAF